MEIPVQNIHRHVSKLCAENEQHYYKIPTDVNQMFVVLAYQLTFQSTSQQKSSTYTNLNIL